MTDNDRAMQSAYRYCYALLGAKSRQEVADIWEMNAPDRMAAHDAVRDRLDYAEGPFRNLWRKLGEWVGS